jgi:predicted ATPase/DNA-binding CsgD family transcriptional regulator
VGSLHNIPLAEPLTTRELDILHLIAEGLSDREIAQKLTLSLETVKWYNKQIYSKLGVRNRTEAAAHAKLLDMPPGGAQALAAEKTVLPAHNLPTQMTSFVGRKRELAEVVQLLNKARLLSITGLAGCGKTRLAVEVAREVLPRFSDGIFFVPLAPIATPDKLLWAIVEQLDLQFFPQTEPLQQLLDHFRNKSLLLVLDNFEHILDGAGLVTHILQVAPDVRILVTSRERLSLYGEISYPIGGLSLIDGNDPDSTRSEAVELFEHRVQAVVPGLKLNADAVHHVARICRLVEGMPLGIELAATWVDVLSPQEIANEIEHSLDILEAELRDQPDSQSSMRASFARSWDLLTDTEKTAFRRLSVFRGGFTREGAAAVTGVGLRTLQALVTKSLLRYDPDSGRFGIHELLRQYAEEYLISSGEAAPTREAHARYFADFMAERWPQMKGHRQKTALVEIENDLDNVRAAWDYWLEVANLTELRKVLHSFWVVYDIRGWYLAGIELFERAVEVARRANTEEAQAVLGWLLAVQGLYYLAGGIYRIIGGPRKGFVLAQEGIGIIEHVRGYDDMMIVPLISLFITASQVNAVDIALAAARECLEVATRIDDQWAVAKAKQFLTVRAIINADLQTAERLAREALDRFEKSGDKWSESVFCIEVLGLLAIARREFDQAMEWIERGLREAEDINFKYSRQMAYWQLGFVATLQEDYSKAAKYWRKALELGEAAIGSPILMGFVGTSNSGEWGGRKLIDRS